MSMSSEVSTNDEIQKLRVAVEAYTSVIYKYLDFLSHICDPPVEGNYTEDDLKRDSRKFSSIREELYNYLTAHENFFDLTKIQLVSKGGSVVYEKEMPLSYNSEDFLKREDILELKKKLISDGQRNSITSAVEYDSENVFDAVKLKLAKTFISSEDVQNFVENSCFFDETLFKTNCSNYRDLKAYIDLRVADHCNYEVSIQNINGKSFRFQGPIEGFEDEKSCPICLEDYETDREVCLLPCNHFCCRVCTETMFSPNEGSQSNVLCPICRDDCT